MPRVKDGHLGEGPPVKLGNICCCACMVCSRYDCDCWFGLISLSAMKRRRERKIDPKDEQKLSFIMEHFQKDSPFDVKKELDDDVQSALQWIGQRSAEQVRAERERITSDIERQGARMWESGACDAWLNKCSHGAREVVKGVNGPMFNKLATSVAFDDMQAIQAFREGAAFFAVLVLLYMHLVYVLAGVPFFGMLDKCNLGQAAECAEPCSMEALRSDCARSNALLLEQLHESEFSAELLELTRADAALGRMSMPVPVEDVDLNSIRLSPRFAVVQGEHEDGRPKVRPVDHFSWSAPPVGTTKREGKKKMKHNSVNGRTKMPEKITYDHVDDLIAMAESLLNELKVVLLHQGWCAHVV